MKTFFSNGKCLYKRQNFYSVFRVCLVLLIKIIISKCSLGQRGGGILWYTLVVETDFIEKAILRKRFKISLIPGGRTRKPDLFMLFVKTKQKTEIGAVLINLKSDYVIFFLSSPVHIDVSMVKNLSVSARDTGDSSLIPGLRKTLEKEKATDSSILAWEIPGTEKPGGLQSIRSQKNWT